MLVAVNSRYEGALQCANTAAEFNQEFKNTLDLAMYNHVIHPRTKNSIAQLPMDELNNAEAVLKDSIENVLKCNKYIKTEEQAINFLWEEINNRGL